MIPRSVRSTATLLVDTPAPGVRLAASGLARGRLFSQPCTHLDAGGRRGELLTDCIDVQAAASGGGDIEQELLGYEKIRGVLAEGEKGLIFLTAHVGNWQLAMTALKHLGRTVHIMMRPEDNAAVKDALAEVEVDESEDGGGSGAQP